MSHCAAVPVSAEFLGMTAVKSINPHFLRPPWAYGKGHRDRDSLEAYNIPAMEPRIQYSKTADGVSIAFCG